jgi:hypothetical protein
MCNKIYILDYFNYENETRMKYFLPKIKKYYQQKWFMSQTASWNTRFVPIFAEVLTRRGYGSTFNMLSDSKLFTEKSEFFLTIQGSLLVFTSFQTIQRLLEQQKVEVEPSAQEGKDCVAI